MKPAIASLQHSLYDEKTINACTENYVCSKQCVAGYTNLHHCCWNKNGKPARASLYHLYPCEHKVITANVRTGSRTHEMTETIAQKMCVRGKPRAQ